MQCRALVRQTVQVESKGLAFESPLTTMGRAQTDLRAIGKPAAGTLHVYPTSGLPMSLSLKKIP